MAFLITILLLVGLTVLPVMIGARMVKAQNTGFGSALLAIIALAALSAAIDHFVESEVVAFIAAIAGGAILLAVVLGTTFLRGLAVSVIVVAIQFAILLALAGGLFGVAAFAT
jgi:hypothetical protein